MMKRPWYLWVGVPCRTLELQQKLEVPKVIAVITVFYLAQTGALETQYSTNFLNVQLQGNKKITESMYFFFLIFYES